jgi:hypothetical protein
MISWEKTWNGWLDIISQDIFDLAMNRHTLRELRKIVAANREIQEPGFFHEWLETLYATTQAVGVRRQNDNSNDVVSLRRLLESLKANANLLTRERFINLYPLRMRDCHAEDTFDKYCGSGRDYLDQAVMDKLLKRLDDTATAVHQLVSKRIAHHVQGASAIATFDDLDKALDSLEDVLKHTVMILQADGLHTAVPVNLENWKAIFRKPWIPT